MTSLLQGLRSIRAGEERDAMHQPRQRTQLNFVTVDPDEHQRQVQAERAALMRERESEERMVALLKSEADAQTRKTNGQPKAKPPGRPRKTKRQCKRADPVQNSAQGSPSDVTQVKERNRYAHLHEDAVRVWFYVTEHTDASLSLSEIAGVLGLTVSEVSHRLRQLENNGIVRRGYNGVITLLKRAGGEA